jgi:hypothetical protein
LWIGWHWCSADQRQENRSRWMERSSVQFRAVDGALCDDDLHRHQTACFLHALTGMVGVLVLDGVMWSSHQPSRSSWLEVFDEFEFDARFKFIDSMPHSLSHAPLVQAFSLSLSLELVWYC